MIQKYWAKQLGLLFSRYTNSVWVHQCGATRGRLCFNQKETEIHAGQSSSAKVQITYTIIIFHITFIIIVFILLFCCTCFFPRGLIIFGQCQHSPSRTSRIASESLSLWVNLLFKILRLVQTLQFLLSPRECVFKIVLDQNIVWWELFVLVFLLTGGRDLCHRGTTVTVLRLPFCYSEQLCVRRRMGLPCIFILHCIFPQRVPRCKVLWWDY